MMGKNTDAAAAALRNDAVNAAALLRSDAVCAAALLHKAAEDAKVLLRAEAQANEADEDAKALLSKATKTAQVLLDKGAVDAEALLRSAAVIAEGLLARGKRLEGIIPICSYCKKIRNDQNSWQQLERYLSEHSDAWFSHGICPDCMEKNMLKWLSDSGE